MTDLTEEKMMILQMIFEGKITAEEGAILLEALTSTDEDVKQKHHKEKHFKKRVEKAKKRKFIFINKMEEMKQRFKKRAEKAKKRKLIFINQMDEVEKHSKKKAKKTKKIKIKLSKH